MLVAHTHNREYKCLYRHLRASSCPSRVSACPRAYIQSKWYSPQGTPSHLVLNRRKLVTRKKNFFQFLPGSLKGRVKLLKYILKWAFATCHLARTIHVAHTLVVIAYALRIARAADRVIIEMCRMQFYRVLLRG